MDSISAIILAAGTSSRMGQPKQLLDWNGRPLLEHVIHQVLLNPFSEVIAVIGYEAEKMKKSVHIRDPRFRWVENKQYMYGQGSSLRAGIQNVDPDSPGMMIFLGDLPFVSNQTIISVFDEGKKMLECGKEPFVLQPVYKKTRGHPVFFGYVSTMLCGSLYGDQGGRAIMKMFKVKKELFVKDGGILRDIDTMDEYIQALNRGAFNGSL